MGRTNKLTAVLSIGVIMSLLLTNVAQAAATLSMHNQTLTWLNKPGVPNEMSDISWDTISTADIMAGAGMAYGTTPAFSTHQPIAKTVGRILFAPAIDADGNPASNPVASTRVPIIEMLGERGGIVILAAQLEVNNPDDIPIGIPVNFRVWTEQGLQFEHTVSSDAWGAVRVEVPLENVNVEYAYQASAPGYETTEVRYFRFDPGQVGYIMHADGAQLSSRNREDGRVLFSLHSPVELDAERDEATLILVRHPNLDTGEESYLDPIFDVVAGAELGLPLPQVAMQIIDPHTAIATVQLPPGDYGAVGSLIVYDKLVERFHSQPQQLSLNVETEVPTGSAIWVSSLEYEPGHTLVAYDGPDGEFIFDLVDVDQVPEIENDWEGQTEFVKTWRTGPFEWQEALYDVSVETLIDDGKKLVSLQDFDYDPISRRYTLAIESLQEHTITDTLRVDILGPGDVVIHHEEAQVTLEPGQTLHYSIEVPAELGQPRGIRVTLDDPFKGIIQSIVAAVRTLYNAVQKGEFSFGYSVKFYVEVFGISIVQYKASVPESSSDGWEWFPNGSKLNLVWKVLKWISSSAWDVTNGRFSLGRAGVDHSLHAGVKFTVDKGKCPDPSALPNIEQRVQALAESLNLAVGNYSIKPSPPIVTPSLPIWWILLIWGQLTLSFGGKVSSSGLSITVKGEGTLGSALHVGLGIPAADYKTALGQLKKLYKIASSIQGVVGTINAAAAIEGWQVPQKECDPDPPDPRPPDDRQDVWQGIESFYQGPTSDETINNLSQLIQQAQTQGLWRAERLLTLRLREAELARFSTDFERVNEYLEEFATVSTDAADELQGIVSGTVPISPTQTITEALIVRMEQMTADLDALPYAQEQQMFMDAVSVAERLYLELRGQELELQHELRQLLTLNKVGVVAAGFAEATLSALQAADLPSQLVSLWPSTGSFRGQPAPYFAPALAPRALIVPSGALHTIVGSPEARAWLEEYVAGGGLLIVFTQAFGSDWAALPGGQVSGLGYEEDQRWQHATVETVEVSDWLVWMGIEKPDIQVDGIFTAWPANAQILLRRASGKHDGLPVMISYPFGKGTVLATTAYGDWAWKAGFWWGDDWQMTRSILIRSYLMVQGQNVSDVEAADPDSTVTVSFPITNTGALTLTSVDVVLPVHLGYWGSDFHDVVYLSLPPGESTTIEATLPTPKVMRGVHNWTQVGLYHLGVTAYMVDGSHYTTSGPFIYVRSPIIPSTVSVNLVAERTKASLYHTILVTATVQNYTSAPRDVTVVGQGDLPSTPIVLTVPPESTVEHVYSLFIDGQMHPGAAFYDDGNLILETEMVVDVAYPLLEATPQIPVSWSEGSVLSFTVANEPYNSWDYGVAVDASLAVTLTAPSGDLLWSDMQTLPYIAIGQTISPTFILPALEALEYGTYELTYRVDDGRGLFDAQSVALPARWATTITLDRDEYRIREPLTMTVEIANTGYFDIEPLLELSIPDLGWSHSQSLTLPAELDSWSEHYAFSVPDSLSTGSYPIYAALQLSDTLTQTTSFFVRPAEVNVQIDSGPYLADHSLPITLTNVGGVDATVAYTLSLHSYDAQFLIGQNISGTLVGAGTSVAVTGTIPTGIRSGTYVLHVQGMHTPDNHPLYSTHIVKILGPEIDLKAYTDREMYLTIDTITVTADLTNTGTPLPEGDLKLTIERDTPNEPGWQIFDMENSGISNNLVMAVSVDNQGNIWFGLEPGGWFEPESQGIEPSWRAPNWTSLVADRLSADLESWDYYSLPNDLEWATWVYEIATDDAGQIWFATNGGVAVLEPSGITWTTYLASESGLLNNEVNAVAVDADGNAWFGTENGANMLTPAGEWFTYTTSTSGILSDWVYAVAVDSDDNVWFGTLEGLSQLTPEGAWISYTVENSGLGADRVVDIALDSDGNVWLANITGEGGGDPGVGVLLTSGEWITYTTQNSDLVSSYVYNIDVDAWDRKWIGYDYDGVSVLSADNLIWDHYSSPPLGNEVVNDIALAPNGDVWLATDGYGPVPTIKALGDGGATRAYGGTGIQDLLWTRSLTVSLDSPDTFTDTSSLLANSLGATGRLLLHAVFSSTAGQELARDTYPFYIFPTDVGLTLDTDRDIYKPGQVLTGTGALVNNTALPLMEQWVGVTQNGELVYAAGPFDLLAGAAFTYTFTSTVPLNEGPVFLENISSQATVYQTVHVAMPQGDAELAAPDVAGSTPFSVTVTISNTGQTDIAIQVFFADGISETLNLVPGQLEVVAHTVAITRNAVLSASVRGDLVFDLSTTVLWGEAATLNFLPPAQSIAGEMTIPYVLTGIGLLPTPVQLFYQLDGDQTFTLTHTLWPGQVLSGNLSLDVPAGPHQVTGELRNLSGQLLDQDNLPLLMLPDGEPLVPDIHLLDVTATPTPVAAGQTVSVTLEIVNMGPAGTTLASLQLFEPMQQWLITPTGWLTQSFTFSLEVPEDVPTDIYFGEANIAGQSLPFTVEVVGTDVEMSLALDQPFYFPGEVAELTITLTDTAGLSADYILMTRYLSAEDYITITLPAGQVVQTTFTFTATEVARSTVFLSHVPTPENGQRVLLLDSLPVPVVQPGQGAYLTHDKLVYNPGETVHMMVNVTGTLASLLVMGPMELALYEDDALLWAPPVDDDGMGLVISATYPLAYNLPTDIRTGSYTFLLLADGQAYEYPIDVRGWKVTTRHITLGKVHYDQEDEIEATVEFWNESEVAINDLRLTAWIFTPEDSSVLELDPVVDRFVDLQPGLNRVTVSGIFTTPETGLHRLVINLGLDGSGWRVAGASTQFDVGWAHLVALNTDHGVYDPGELGIGRLDVYGFGPTQLVVTATNGTTLLDDQFDLMGFTTYTFTIPTTDIGDYLLVAQSIDQNGIPDRLIRAYAVPPPRDTQIPVITLTYPHTDTLITTSVPTMTLTVTGDASDDSGEVLVILNGETITPTATGAFTTDIVVRQGLNLISAAAMDPSGNVAYTPIVPVQLMPNRAIVLSVDQPNAQVGDHISFTAVLTTEYGLDEVHMIQVLPSAMITDVVVTADNGRTGVGGLDPDFFVASWSGEVSSTLPTVITIEGQLLTAGVLTQTAAAYWGWGFIDDSNQVDVLVEPVVNALSINKTAYDLNGAPLYPGDLISYTITITNPTEMWVEGVSLTDTLSAYIAYMPDSGTPPPDIVQDHMLIWQDQALAPGVNTYQYQALIGEDAVGQEIVNTARISNDVAAVTLGPVDMHPLSIDKFAADVNGGRLVVSDMLVYTVTLTNNSGYPISGVTIQDSIPDYTTYLVGSAEPDAVLGGGVLTWAEQVIPPGTSTFIFIVVVDNNAFGQQISNVALFTWSEQPARPPVNTPPVEPPGGGLVQGVRIYLPMTIR